jgi:hypothetical protein
MEQSIGSAEFAEHLFTQGRGGPEIRPFSESAEVACRSCSIPLQRTITDFGADASFGGGTTRKLKEHYGIEVPATVIRAITERHGESMSEMERRQRLTQGNSKLDPTLPCPRLAKVRRLWIPKNWEVTKRD